ncbi:hypothetical protein DPMN_193437 [Dreissena polymorpha]|uniref:Uncharacterized protein n=1 Tax=Dreissena polymorpha TaxID=45954 RepID=A0A9D3Y1A4_DREPO|nr:hypothetical protein DPMN_193437 [Dreissena polymorpha]
MTNININCRTNSNINYKVHNSNFSKANISFKKFGLADIYSNINKIINWYTCNTIH